MQDPSTSLPATPQPGLWRFGAAVLDEQRAVLRVGIATVELDRSSYDVLLALLRHAGEVVTKDELLESGWPGRVVSENALAKAVGRLRQALGADGECIRAVHGYGYRLAAAVSFQPPAAGPAAVHPHEAAGDHDLAELRELLAHPKAVAVGETGLDHYRDYAPRDRQRALFEAQLALASELGDRKWRETFQPGSLDVRKLHQALYERDHIVCATRGGIDRGGVRFSPHFYNLEADVTRAIDAVRGYMTRGL